MPPQSALANTNVIAAFYCAQNGANQSVIVKLPSSYTKTPFGITELTNCEPTRTLVLNTSRFLRFRQKATDAPTSTPRLWEINERPSQARTMEMPCHEAQVTLLKMYCQEQFSM
jgi:hypothetical protein